MFDLTDEMAVPDPPPPPAAASFRKIEPQDDLEFTEIAAAKALHRQPAYEPPPFESAAAAAAQQILSRSTVSAVESAFNSLANTVLSNNARTLEDLVKEMLRPMLKSWLDDNLPGLVERIVKAEIERVSRGGRLRPASRALVQSPGSMRLFSLPIRLLTSPFSSAVAVR